MIKEVVDSSKLKPRATKNKCLYAVCKKDRLINPACIKSVVQHIMVAACVSTGTTTHHTKCFMDLVIGAEVALLSYNSTFFPANSALFS